MKIGRQLKNLLRSWLKAVYAAIFAPIAHILYKPILDEIRATCPRNESTLLLELFARERLFASYKILDPLESIDFLVRESKSFLRIGDGEMMTLANKAGGFHRFSPALKADLLACIEQACRENLPIGLNPVLIYPYHANRGGGGQLERMGFGAKSNQENATLESQTQSEATTQISPRLLYACENISAFYVAAYFPSDRVYFDANMFYTTPIEVALLARKIDTYEYERLESRLKAFPRLFIDDDYGRWLLQLYKELLIHKIAKLWEQKDCIVIEGRYYSSGVHNDLFSNARSVLRINHLPHHDAYEHLDEFKGYVQEVLSGFDPTHTCAILALGHSAKILGFWLDGLGFKAFDIGSLSLNYDCFLYGADFYTYAGQGNPLELESYVLTPYIDGKHR